MAPAGESMYLAIQVDETPTQNSAGVLAIDTENGDRRWRSNYIDPQGAEGAHADSIAVSPDGQHVYVGMSFNLVPRLLLAFGSTDGQLLWEGDLSASLFGRVADLAVSADGGKVFGTGNLGFNLWTWAIDAENGNVLWEHEFHRQRGDSAQAAAAVAVSGGGHVVVTGQSSRIVCQVMDCTQASDIITIAYDAATGLRLWRALLGDRSVDAPDVGKDVVVHPDGGSALVSGWTTQSGSSSDIVAIAYEL
jgi:outer membrane protein assembly factor BamB